ncbi:MAG: protein kinase domain-containing protein [Myxococcota bacterium]
MASKSSADLDRGRRIGKYEVITRLSVGGMAELFLAFIPGPGGFKKFVALKQILPDVRADDSFVKMFLDEARITAAFNHPNIGQVFDLGEEREELYLAMEFIAGQNLEQTIKRAAKKELPIPVGFAARVIRDTALGLHYAHTFTDPTGQSMGVVHRDVSPKNVMITWNGQVKVIDFGIAKARGRLNRTQVGIVKGTSGYMSPEQVKNEPLDGRTDLFAAAVMLHELLAGERLFTAPTDAAMMLKIVDGDVTPPTANNPYVSQELSDVVMKGLARSREQRFATGKEFARAIEQACPDLFDDEQLAEFMAQLFEDKIAITRSLLEAANSSSTDQAQMKQAAVGLTTDERDVEARPAKKTGAGAPVKGSATPHPRPGLANGSKAGASSQKLPRVATKESKAALSSRSLPPVGKSVARLPKVQTEEDTVRPGTRSPLAPPQQQIGDETLPPRGRSQMKLPKVEQPKPEQAKAAQPPPPPVEKKGGGVGGLLAVGVIVLVLGGLGWAVFAGPLKDQFSAVREEPAPVDNGPKKIDLGQGAGDGDKPAWLVEKEKQKAELEAERKRQAEIEAQSNDPERQALLAQLEADLKQLDYLEAEQRSLKLAAQQGQATGAANTKKIEDLQKQIDELKNLVAAKQKKTGTGVGSASEKKDDVEVVKDSRTAKQASLGYLSMRTINPSAANVLLGGDAIGSTPFMKVPIEAGTHKLVVIDGDGRSRLLSVNIEPGKTTELRAIDVASLPLAP